MRVTVAYAVAARTVHETQLDLPRGATVAQALQGLPSAWSLKGFAVSVWGRRAESAQVLRDGDRIELCRALRVDPKVARRERFQKQGARSAGLFAQRRPGSKAGY